MTALNDFWRRNRKTIRKRLSACQDATLQCERYGFDQLESRLLLTASTVTETRQLVIAGFVSTVAAPATPTNVVATPANGRATLIWSATVNISTIRSTRYEVQYSADGGASWTTSPIQPLPLRSATVTGLSNGTSYIFRVSTINAFGKSAYSATSSPVVPVAPPAVPKSLTATPGNTKVLLQWTAPSDGGRPITNYAIQYSMNNGRSWTTFARTASTATNATVTGLTNGRNYVFRVAAINELGMGAFTQKTNAIKPAITVPGTPDSVALAYYPSFRLSWNAPNDGGSPITGYSVRTSTDDGATWVTFASNEQMQSVDGKVQCALGLFDDSNPIVRAARAANSRVIFSVSATNAVGPGGWGVHTARLRPPGGIG
jgi:hypothetical protein